MGVLDPALQLSSTRPLPYIPLSPPPGALGAQEASRVPRAELRSFLVRLGLSWVWFWAVWSWACPVVILGRLVAILGRLGAVWVHPGTYLAMLGPSCGVLGPS